MAVITNPQMGGQATNRIIPITAVTGTVASPIATVSGTTGALFTLPAAIIIPAGMITPNSRVWINAQMKRTGANATANFGALLGTTNSSSDPTFTLRSSNATNNHVGWIWGSASFGSSTTAYVSNGITQPQNSNAAGTDYGDFSSNINTAAAMYVNIGMSSANALDSFALINYRVWIEY